ncbi:serine/threonine-protein kinase [Ruicaihuangia caeni]|uniref:non-specific serine/threonine protein kinase n=1 Tax=Ruicaihuangia caeni TaxID=3042517 RepID=A0AAW6T5V4_9MICO|nr:serine/threonine-protein kinase [Klugiella sp. YN-L-19]MDI2099157.1 serine/threonine-protein kinase [Klugiella sp. YN-L-19]
MRPTSGLTFGGRYQLSSRVAIGGMGEVWEATDLIIGRTVAIKILKDEYMGDPGFLERFRAEARHAALVNHEGIANVYDYGEEEGSAYLVMELVPGEALSAIIERERVLSSDRVLDIVAQTANALHAAHSAGLVHRDIKPGNLLITPEGRVKITDFGIARIADQVPLTATGQVMGTVQYLAPEQASGQPATPSTDIYSLGIVAYEALAGRRPFTGESQVAIAMAQINEAPPELPSTVAEPVRNLVYSSIAKKPEDRPASAAHLARAAQALRRGDVAGAAVAVPGILGTGAIPTAAGGDAPTQVLGATQVLDRTDTTPVEEQRKRNPWTWPLIALIALLAIVLAGTIFALLNRGADENPGPSTTSSAPTTPPTTSEPPSSPPPTSQTAAVLRDELLGLTQEQVAARLNELGMGFAPSIGRVAPSPGEVGLSYEVSPYGNNVQVGTVINVTFYDEIPPPPAPTKRPAAPTVESGPDAPAPGDEVTVRWATYDGCPAGAPLSGYILTASSGGTFANGTPGADATQTVFRIASDYTGDISISYIAKCGDQTSPSSPATTFTVAAPPTEGTPGAGTGG